MFAGFNSAFISLNALQRANMRRRSVYGSCGVSGGQDEPVKQEDPSAISDDLPGRVKGDPALVITGIVVSATVVFMIAAVAMSAMMAKPTTYRHREYSLKRGTLCQCWACQEARYKDLKKFDKDGGQ